MENISSDRKFLTADDVAKILQVSKSTAYRIIRKIIEYVIFCGAGFHSGNLRRFFILGGIHVRISIRTQTDRGLPTMPDLPAILNGLGFIMA